MRPCSAKVCVAEQALALVGASLSPRHPDRLLHVPAERLHWHLVCTAAPAWVRLGVKTGVGSLVATGVRRCVRDCVQWYKPVLLLSLSHTAVLAGCAWEHYLFSWTISTWRGQVNHTIAAWNRGGIR